MLYDSIAEAISSVESKVGQCAKSGVTEMQLSITLLIVSISKSNFRDSWGAWQKKGLARVAFLQVFNAFFFAVRITSH